MSLIIKTSKNEINAEALGGSLVPRAGLSATSLHEKFIVRLKILSTVQAFRYYPCRGLITLLICITSIQAQAQVLSLDSVLAMIDRHNPMLAEYDNKVKALNEYSAGAKSWMAPMVGAGTFMTPYNSGRATEANEKGSWMFSMEQQIPNPIKQNANKTYLQSKAAVEKQGRAMQFNNLRSEAKAHYYQLLADHKKLSILHENEDIVKLMIKLARIRYPYNQGTLGNIYTAESRLTEIQNMVLMTQSDMEEKTYRLMALVNMPALDSLVIDTTTLVNFKPEQLVNDTVALSAQRSDVRQINQEIEVMRLNQQLQKNQAKPDFKIRFDHMQPIGNMPTQFTAMAMVSIPIAPWSSRMYKAEVRGMNYDIEAMKKSREAILLEARGMVAGMAAKIARMSQQLHNYETRIIPALQKNYQSLMVAYEENREQLPMVIDGWEALNMAQLEYVGKLEGYYEMVVQYEKEIER